MAKLPALQKSRIFSPKNTPFLWISRSLPRPEKRPLFPWNWERSCVPFDMVSCMTGTQVDRRDMFAKLDLTRGLAYTWQAPGAGRRVHQQLSVSIPQCPDLEPSFQPARPLTIPRFRSFQAGGWAVPGPPGSPRRSAGLYIPRGLTNRPWQGEGTSSHREH